MMDSIKATRIKPQHEAIVSTWECSVCEDEFPMFVGYPSYCPECGVEFTERDDGSPLPSKDNEA